MPLGFTPGALFYCQKIVGKGIDKVIKEVYNSGDMAKYDGLRKLERNRLLVEYAKSHTDYSLREIGEAFNISASRTWHILHKDKNGKGKSSE